MDFKSLQTVLTKLLPSTGRTVGKLAERIEECDLDKNGKIDFQEFQRSCVQSKIMILVVESR